MAVGSISRRLSGSIPGTSGRLPEMEEEMANGNGGKVLGGAVTAFLAGAATGAAVALLTSPKSGPELRATIGGKVDEVRRKVKGLVAARKDAGAAQPVQPA